MTIENSELCNNTIEESVDQAENKCVKDKTIHSCEVMIDFKTCLCPPPKKDTEVEHCERVEAEIKKICEGKIIIGGILHKTIVYTSRTQCKCNERNCIKHKDIPFSCYIDIGCEDSECMFEIIDCRTICTFTEVIEEDEGCCEKAILEEKDIIKIKVRRSSCHHHCDECHECHECPEKKKRKFCGKAVVDSEICFVPAVNPAAASVSVNIDPVNFKVQLISCDLIVVCGFFTKIVTFNDGTHTAKKDILVQLEIPTDINKGRELDIDKWEVTKAEVCTGCFGFTCPDSDGTLFHKLVEKDIIAVQVQKKLWDK